VLVRTGYFTDISQDASTTNNQIISWAYHSSFSGFPYLPPSRSEIPWPMPTRNAEISILNSLLNFVRRESLTRECSDCQFYITLFDHPIENTLGICRLRKDSVAPSCIFFITSRLYPRWSTAKQHKKNPKVGNPVPVHYPLA
jgi:hypothetical protein